MADEEQWAMWMRSAISGDNAQYQLLLRALVPFLRAVARRRCQDFGIPAFECEDLVQETLLAIHLKRGTWHQTRPLIPWISTILRYKAIDRARRNLRHHTLPIDGDTDDLCGCRALSVGDAIDMRRILGSLRPPQRRIVQSLSLDGFSVRETAEALNMTEGAVRVSLHRTIRHLSAEYARSVNSVKPRQGHADMG